MYTIRIHLITGKVFTLNNRFGPDTDHCAWVLDEQKALHLVPGVFIPCSSIAYIEYEKGATING